MARSPRTDAKFRRIYDGHFVAIRSYCLRRLPASEVSDAVAEVFLVVWRRIDDVPDQTTPGLPASTIRRDSSNPCVRLRTSCSRPAG